MCIDQRIRLVRLLADLEPLKSYSEDQLTAALERTIRRYLQNFPDIEVRCLPSRQDNVSAPLHSAALSFPTHGICVFEVFSAQVILLKSPQNSLFTTIEIEEVKQMADFLMRSSCTARTHAHMFLLYQLKNSLLDEAGIGFVVLDEQAEQVEMNQLAKTFFQQEYPQLDTKEACLELMRKFSPVEGVSPLPFSSLTLGDFSFKRRGETDLDPFGYASTLYSIEIKPIRFKGRFQKKFQLSAREGEILDLLYEGLSNEAIAAKLFISTNTLRTHLKSIYKKADVSNQKQLLYLYGTYLRP